MALCPILGWPTALGCCVSKARLAAPGQYIRYVFMLGWGGERSQFCVQVESIYVCAVNYIK